MIIARFMPNIKDQSNAPAKGVDPESGEIQDTVDHGGSEFFNSARPAVK